MLRAYTFDDNIDIPSWADAGFYSMLLTKQTGIWNKYNKCDVTAPIDYSVSGYGTIKFNSGAINICGRVIYIDADTELAIPLTATSTGSIGVKVDLSQAVGEQVDFYSKTTQSLTQQDLNENKNGVYEFEIFKYTSNGVSITLTKQNNLIEPLSEILEVDGATIKKATEAVNCKPNGTDLLVVNNKINYPYLPENKITSEIIAGSSWTDLYTENVSLINARLKIYYKYNFESDGRNYYGCLDCIIPTDVIYVNLQETRDTGTLPNKKLEVTGSMWLRFMIKQNSDNLILQASKWVHSISGTSQCVITIYRIERLDI